MKPVFKMNTMWINYKVLIVGDDWRIYRKESKSHMHLLKPIEMHIVLQKCRLDKQDRNLAK